MQIFFYFDCPKLEELPRNMREFIEWQRDLGRSSVLMGPSNWAVQTCLELREHGFECELVNTIPDSGIIVAHHDHIPPDIDLEAQRFWVCILADRIAPHSNVQYHVLQNPNQRLRFRQKYGYIQHWPQPGLIPRSPSRTTQVRNLRFYGESYSIVVELTGDNFRSWCVEHGFSFECVPRPLWHDYSECDISIAVRSFDEKSWFHDKPASKLFNSWIAGVPAILNRESAYRFEGTVGYDYVEVRSYADLCRELLRLKNSPEDYNALVARGSVCASRVRPTEIANRWIRLLREEITPAAASWQRQSPLSLSLARLNARIRAGLAWRGLLSSA